MHVLSFITVIVCLQLFLLHPVESHRGRSSLVKQRFLAYNGQVIKQPSQTAVILTPTQTATPRRTSAMVRGFAKLLVIGLMMVGILYVPVNEVSIYNLEHMQEGGAIVAGGCQELDTSSRSRDMDVPTCAANDGD